MSINPYDSPETASPAAARKPAWLRFRLVELLVVIGVIGVLIALMLPAVRTSGEAARRSNCSNNLKQIAIALHNYEDEYGAFPPAYTVDAEGKPLHSWRTLILPYLEGKSVYHTIDLSKPWDDPANKEAYDSRVLAYQCPSVNLSEGTTTYLAVVGPQSCLQATRPRALVEITDNKVLTLLVMEVDAAHAVHWMSPTDASEQLIVNFAAAEKLSHLGGAYGVFVDGQVRYLPKETKAAKLRAFISVAGGDDEDARAAD